MKNHAQPIQNSNLKSQMQKKKKGIRMEAQALAAPKITNKKIGKIPKKLVIEKKNHTFNFNAIYL